MVPIISLISRRFSEREGLSEKKAGLGFGIILCALSLEIAVLSFKETKLRASDQRCFFFFHFFFLPSGCWNKSSLIDILFLLSV